MPEERSVGSEDFAEEKDMAIDLAEGFDLRLWAPGPLLANAVAVSFDKKGMAYVSETRRRKSSDLDIREHRDWMIEDLALSTLEETDAFHREKLATDKSASNKWMNDYNGDSLHDYRDLAVQSEIIRQVWDSDGDGRADKSKVFAEEFNEMLGGVAAGILVHQDEVFLTQAPNLYRVKDENKDDYSDGAEIISHGFGIHIAYAGHDMSGLTIGPDGKIYWSIGDIGVNVVDQNGKRWAYPHEGAVMRCNPDGSDFEVFAHGLRNPQEIAFDAYGNLISVDNDSDHPVEHERFVHILQGSDTGWRIYWQFGKYNKPYEDYRVWIDEGLHLPQFSGQAAYITPALALAPDGPAGLAFNPGTALGENWNNYFFASYFKGAAARSKLEAFRLEPKGASFRVADEKNIITGIASTGVNFAPDGALYINDWKDGYALKPEGRIWKLDLVEPRRNPQRSETQQILSEGFTGLGEEMLYELIDHLDMRVRQGAQFELVKRGNAEELLDLINTAETEFGQLHAIWGYGQLMRNNAELGSQLFSLLSNPNPIIQSQLIKVLGDAYYQEAAEEIMPLLNNDDDRVKYFAAETLGKLKYREAFQPMVNMLANLGDADPHLRHGLSFALSKLGLEKELGALSTHDSRWVRLSAVVALRHSRSDQIAPFINDGNNLVVTEAARAIHDDESIMPALPALAKALETSTCTEEPFVRRAINANLRLGDQNSARRLRDYLVSNKGTEEMKLQALWSLGLWSEPPTLDRVEGKVRELPARETADAAELLSNHISSLMQSRDTAMQVAAIHVAGNLSMISTEQQLQKILKNNRQSSTARSSALAALFKMKSDVREEALNYSLSSDDAQVRLSGQALLSESDLSDEVVAEMLGKVLEIGNTAEKQMAIRGLGSLSAAVGEPLISKLVHKMQAPDTDPAILLDIVQAATGNGSKSLEALLTKYESSKNAEDMLSVYREVLYGGDEKKGRDIFALNESAQCLRCHAVSGYGGEIGPGLSNIGNELSREDLLLSLVDPSDRIAPGYGTVSITLQDSSVVSGILLEENVQNTTLRIGSEEERVIDNTQIAERLEYPSGMLDMKNLLSKEELRDLMAFLVTLKGQSL